MDNYKRLLKYVKPYWGRLFTAMVCMGILSLTTVALAYLTKPMLDDIFIQKNVSMLKIIPLAIIGIGIIKGLAEYTQAYLMVYVGLSVVRNIRDALYHHLQTLSTSFFTKTPTGVLISRITNDVNFIQRAVSDTITSVAKDVFTIIGLTCLVFYNDWRLAILAFLVFPWATIAIYKFGRKVRKFATRSQEKMADISTHLHETITGNRVIKAFGMEKYENERFSKENRKYFRYILKRMKVRALSSPVMETFGILGSALFIFYGGYSVIKGQTTPGAFFSSMVALMMLYEPVKRLNKANQSIQEGLAGATRIFAVLDTKPEIVDHSGAIELSSIKSGVEFKNVSFKYEDDLVLNNINLKTRVGDIIALVGPSGAGKTTLINLIPRFYDVIEGQIIIDGHDIRKITLRSLRANIGLVTQQTILFNDTIKYNISYGNPEKTEQEIVSAAKAANAHKFIQKFPQGYDTIIGEQGVKISGGEKQRLTIARAILKDAPILILDEATSSLDSESELEVQKALEYLMVNRTTFVIAHRLSTIKKANKIIVISSGKIVGEGRHEELLKANLIYKKLYETQFRGYQSPPIKETSSLAGKIKTSPTLL
ncbi:MAG: lipid A export permease/ATP-binding protein MsbA [Deltaproteobacteria bacterium]|nr:lipid A export permease/ATP-binding protein MsbA [Deltaproteobacteria bacterium]